MYILAVLVLAEMISMAMRLKLDWGGALPQPYWRSVSTYDGEIQALYIGCWRYLIMRSGIRLHSRIIWLASMWQPSKIRAFIQGGCHWFGMAQVQDATLTLLMQELECCNLNWSDPDFDVTRRKCSLLHLQGQPWCVGGFTNYIAAVSMVKPMYSSADGLTWRKSVSDRYSAMYHVLWLLAMMLLSWLVENTWMLDGSTHVLSNKVYRTTDGVNWTEVTTVPS